MTRIYSSSLVAVAVLALAAAVPTASPSQRFGFFPHPKPTPPTPNPTQPGTTPMNPNNPQLMQHHQQQRLFFLMMLARMQSQQPTYPVTISNMSSMPYPYPMPYPTPPANVPMPAAVKNEAPALPLLAGITDAQGHVAWPLGLQILRPALETKELRQQIESSLVSAAQQAASGGRAAEPMVAATSQAV